MMDRAHSVPHFIGIGAPRCGTTWVFKMLRLHPQIWMPWKEIHFFDSMDPDTDSGFHIQSRLFRLRKGFNYALRRLAVRSIPGAAYLTKRFFPLKAVHAPGFRWATRYFLGTVSLQWYAELFREGMRVDLKCGEITPAYFMLSANGIAGLADVLPNVRIFLLLRNPVDWAWSDICKKVRALGQQPADLSDEALIRHCPLPDGRSRADFGSNLSRWLEHFPRERMLISFHEEIGSEPAEFLDRLCTFMDIDPFPPPLRVLSREPINTSTRGIPMPPAVERFAAQHFRREAAVMAERIGGQATQWLTRIDRVLLREQP